MTKINKNKNYFKSILVVILLLLALYFLGFKFLRYPSEHIYWMLPTESSVIIFSIIGILGCFLALYIILKAIFKKDAFLKIDKDGILNGFSFYNNKFIRWEEIKQIESFRYNHNNYIRFFLKNPKNNEKGINYFLYKMNESSMGTAHILSSGDLDCTFEELEKAVLDGWENYKKTIYLNLTERPNSLFW
jgi:hypothetical protein